MEYNRIRFKKLNEEEFLNFITIPKNFKSILINSGHSMCLKTNYQVVVSYDDWEIFIYQDKFYVADKYNKFIKEVELIKVERSVNIDNDPVDFPDCDYCGQSDDFEYDLGFKLVKD